MTRKGFFFIVLFLASLVFTGCTFEISFFDEVMCVLLLVWGVKRHVLKNKVFQIVVLYSIAHLLFSLFFPENTPKAMLLELLMYAKPFACAVVLGAGYVTFLKKDYVFIRKILFLLLVILFFDELLSLVVDNADAAKPSFFIYRKNLFLAASITIVTLFFILVSNEWKIAFNKKVFFYSIPLLLTIPLTLQGKYNGFVLTYLTMLLFSFWFFPKMQNGSLANRRIYKCFFIIAFFLALMGALYVSFDDLNKYYFSNNDKEARNVLLYALPSVLKGPFLITGRGFASFCSPITQIYYPPHFLDKIGISSIWGLSRDFPNFMADAYSWSFLGTFGLVGSFLFFLFLVYIMNPFVKLYKVNKLPARLFFVSVMCFLWICIFSFGSSLMYGYGPFVLIIWGIARYEALCLLKDQL